jgi:hypothetical protein
MGKMGRMGEMGEMGEMGVAVNGCWLLAAGCWLLAAGCWLRKATPARHCEGAQRPKQSGRHASGPRLLDCFVRPVGPSSQ